MQSTKNKVVIITGASSGIGEETARKLGEAGTCLMLGARRADRLKTLSKSLGPNVAWLETDVTKRSSLESLAQATIDRFGHIDALINNAGIMPLSLLSAGRVDDWDKMIDVNVKGVLYGIHAVLNHMLERGKGHIINIASVAGHVVGPTSAVYSGTKFAIRAISEGLRQETAGKIRVTIISPGSVKTELRNSVTDSMVQEALGKWAFSMPASAIADAIAYAINQPDDVAVNEIIVRPTAQAL